MYIFKESGERGEVVWGEEKEEKGEGKGRGARERGRGRIFGEGLAEERKGREGKRHFRGGGEGQGRMGGD